MADHLVSAVQETSRRPARPAASASAPPVQGHSPSHDWDSELFVLRGDDRIDLSRRVEELRQFLERQPEVVLKDLAFTLNTELAPGGSRLAVVAGSVKDLDTRLSRALQRLADPQCRQIKDAVGIYYFDQPLHPEGRVAFLFPGEGAQYRNMLGDVCRHFPEARRCFEEGDPDRIISRAIFVPETANAQEQAQADKELRQLGNAMFSVLMSDWALYQLLGQMEIRPDALAGHSMGELPALWASGALDPDCLLIEQVAATIDGLQRQEAAGAVGEAILLAVGAGRQVVAEVIRDKADPAVFLAMDNCPHQTVVVGPPAPMAAIEAELQGRRILCERLPFRRPYHTPLFEPFMGPLHQMFERATFRPPHTRVYSCTTSQPFPLDADTVRHLTVTHWARPVEFTRLIENMYADGVRLFVEVGPRGNLSAFVEDILRGKSFAALPANVQRRSGLTQINHLAGQLAAHHVPCKLDHLYRRRDPRRVPWQPKQGATLDMHTADATMAANGEGAPTKDHLDPALLDPQQVSGAGPMSRGAVLSQYLTVMEQFLDVQHEVMDQYLAARAVSNGLAATEPGLIEWPPLPAEGTPTPADTAAPSRRPMLGTIVRHEPGRELVMRRRLDLSEDYFANHHTVGGRTVSKVNPEQHGLPVMPMTFSLEMSAEVASLLVPAKVVLAIQDVRLLRWLAFDEQEAGEVEVTARLLPEEEAGKQHVAVTIRDLGTASQPVKGLGVALEGTVVLADQYPEAPPPGPFHLTNTRPSGISLETMYHGLFHGPLFMGVVTTDVLGDEGIEAQVRVLPREGLFRSQPDPDFITDPVLVDVAMHPLASWHLEHPDQSGRILLPYELKSIEFFGPRPAVGTEFTSRGLIEQATARQFTHGVELIGRDGRLWCRMTSAGYWRFYLPFGRVNFHGPKDEYYLSKAWPVPLEKCPVGSARCQRLEVPADLRQAGMRLVTAQVTLSPWEMEQFRGLQKDHKKQHRWLFGRIAAKDAIRSARRDHNGERLFPADIEIEQDRLGRPSGRRRPGFPGKVPEGALPTVSIAHTDSTIVALAAVTPHVGIDAERVKPRDSTFENSAFDEGERRLLDLFPDRNEGIARLWCAKQAVAKALGNLGEGPRSVVVKAVDRKSGTIQVALARDLAAAFPEFQEALLLARTTCDADLVVAISFCEHEAA